MAMYWLFHLCLIHVISNFYCHVNCFGSSVQEKLKFRISGERNTLLEMTNGSHEWYPICATDDSAHVARRTICHRLGIHHGIPLVTKLKIPHNAVNTPSFIWSSINCFDEESFSSNGSKNCELTKLHLGTEGTCKSGRLLGVTCSGAVLILSELKMQLEYSESDTDGILHVWIEQNKTWGDACLHNSKHLSKIPNACDRFDHLELRNQALIAPRNGHLRPLMLFGGHSHDNKKSRLITAPVMGRSCSELGYKNLHVVCQMKVTINNHSFYLSMGQTCLFQSGLHSPATLESPPPLCRCDDACSTHDDCCYDKLYNSTSVYVKRKYPNEESSFKCVPLTFAKKANKTGVMMVSKCPRSWKNLTIAQQCGFDIFQENSTDFEVQVYHLKPVMNATTYFKNIFCAICHGIKDTDLTILNLSSPCLPADDNLERRPFNLDECTYRVEVPPSSSTPNTRNCWANLVDNCSTTDNDKDAGCSAYTAVVYKNGKLFRNPHCADCNFVLIKPGVVQAFQHMAFPVSQPILRNDMEGISQTELDCIQYALNEGLDSSPNCSSVLPRKPDNVDYEVKSLSESVILAGNIFFGVSSIALLVTFLMYSTVPDLRNLHGACVMFLVGSLFVSQVLLEYVNPYFTNNSHICLMLGIIAHFAWLSVAGWTLILGWDLYTTFSRSINFGSSYSARKLFCYSLVGFGIPFCIVGISVAVHLMSSDQRIYLTGPDDCWLRTGNYASLFCFALPFFLSVIINIFFLVLTVKNIRTSHRMSAKVLSIDHHVPTTNITDVFIALKISLVLGLNWISGIIAYLVNTDLVWVAFILINSLQGVLILVFFGCNQRVRMLWTKRLFRKRSTITRTEYLSVRKSTTVTPTGV